MKCKESRFIIVICFWICIKRSRNMKGKTGITRRSSHQFFDFQYVLFHCNGFACIKFRFIAHIADSSLCIFGMFTHHWPPIVDRIILFRPYILNGVTLMRNLRVWFSMQGENRQMGNPGSTETWLSSDTDLADSVTMLGSNTRNCWMKSLRNWSFSAKLGKISGEKISCLCLTIYRSVGHSLLLTTQGTKLKWYIKSEI